MSFLIGVILLAVGTALACALLGAFVVLRRNSMLVDAIGHAVFPGIVVGYWFTQDLSSPWLLLAAALSGLIVVLGSELLERTGLVAGDAPQGLIFPALFSIGILMVSTHFSNLHLDTHTVLVGDLNLAAFDQLVIGGTVLGPTHLYVMLGVLALDVAFIALCYPALKLTTFNQSYAASLGLRTVALNTTLMFLVALTVTAAFYAVGAILVLALIVVPAATAALLAHRMSTMIALTLGFAAGGSFLGFWLAYVLNAATSAGIAVFLGLMFTAVLLVRHLLGAQRRRQAGYQLIRESAAQAVQRSEVHTP
ncbi:metal ABC transporter permease [Citricoccus muralis]|uniref:Metal ABC transporter permease n=1 Tax=Citricoccus muralis TaxID=169134 RepID=A0ABY8H8G5_9MICC|nr:metal ABC transporter permease [Citricoccus muralis]WFP17435.1 metal ABC transporter permease [Citricoccus muralis]